MELAQVRLVKAKLQRRAGNGVVVGVPQDADQSTGADQPGMIAHKYGKEVAT